MSGTVLGYQALITAEHQTAAKFMATIALTVQPFVDNAVVVASMPGLFDLDVAVGQQLDFVGQWVGQSRFVKVPLAGVYFTWGGTGPGWALGYWQGPNDPTTGVTALDDTTYRLLLRARIAANSWDGTTPGAQAALSDLFNGSTTPGTLLWVDDTMNMTMTFVISEQWPPALFAAVLAGGLIPLVPGAVQARYVETSVNGSPVFAWGMSNSYGAGWGTGAWAAPIGS